MKIFVPILYDNFEILIFFSRQKQCDCGNESHIKWRHHLPPGSNLSFLQQIHQCPTVSCNSQLHLLMGTNLSICHPVFLKMQLLRFIAYLPWSLDSMLSKNDASKTAQRVQFLKVDEFRLVLQMIPELKEMSLLHYCKSSMQDLLSLIVAESFSALVTAALLHLRRYARENTTRHTNVSIPKFSLTARCGTSAVPGDLWPQHKLYTLPCRLLSGCTQPLKTRFAEALERKIFQPHLAHCMPSVTCRKGSCDGCLALPFRARQREPWVTAPLLPAPGFKTRSSTAEQHTSADATQISGPHIFMVLLYYWQWEDVGGQGRLHGFHPKPQLWNVGSSHCPHMSTADLWPCRSHWRQQPVLFLVLWFLPCKSINTFFLNSSSMLHTDTS